jgi:hypothetical protein
MEIQSDWISLFFEETNVVQTIYSNYCSYQAIRLWKNFRRRGKTSRIDVDWKEA